MGKKTNITLIGMPASGKSSVGVVLAKRLGKKFVDTDIVIQEKYGKLLKELIEEHGDEGFREIEDEVNAGLDLENSIISPGGSVVYGEKAMQHLKEISVIIYLELSYTAIKSRLGDLRERGITLKEGQSLKDLYLERVPLYEKYADITVNEMKKTLAKTIEEICERLGEKPKKRRNFKSKRAPFAPKDKQGKDSSQKSRTAKNIREKNFKDKSIKDNNIKDKNFKDKNFKDRFNKEKSDISNNNKDKTNNNKRKNIKKYFKKNEN